MQDSDNDYAVSRIVIENDMAFVLHTAQALWILLTDAANHGCLRQQATTITNFRCVSICLLLAPCGKGMVDDTVQIQFGFF